MVHDSNLKRVTGADVIVEDLTSTDLVSYPLKIDGRLPLFTDILNLIDGKVPLLIELTFGNRFDKGQADAILDS